jgi:hypothetical protein
MQIKKNALSNLVLEFFYQSKSKEKPISNKKKFQLLIIIYLT